MNNGNRAVILTRLTFSNSAVDVVAELFFAYASKLSLKSLCVCHRLCGHCGGVHAVNAGELFVGQYDHAMGRANVLDVVCDGPGQSLEPVVDGPAVGSVYRG